ncbi:uncharacterized protein JN550_001121 [Neoarthrinium moseri]|uniref:uncharacterized protein n=1 Tax=Neoarthrinium moseri TaxID=1658444 RepID=UPI001FDBCD2E|nr:uncharacterized protein JN550_001121 [Neoarthrinium moseri]KAI1877049.1 hypothetical protein JN550_001121 [Neoarthrinium moseri]
MDRRDSNNWRRPSIPRSISAIDGATSRLPSSITSYTPGHTPPLRTAQSSRDLTYPLTSTPPITAGGIDPPRAAREGYEWVWFPQGYWAERERVEYPGTPSGGKGFRWRKKSGRGGSSSHTDNSTGTAAIRFSPKGQHHSPKAQLGQAESLAGKAPLPSPYLTEADHVLSLQRPGVGRKHTSEESMASSTRSILPGRSTTTAAHIVSNSPLSLPLESAYTSHSNETTTPSTAEMDFNTMTPTDFSAYADLRVKTVKPKRSFMALCPRSKLHDSIRVEKLAQDTFGDPSTSPTGDMPAATVARIAHILREGTRSPPNGGKSRARKLFGRSPWHRKTSGESSYSVSSSIREILRGNTPHSSPAGEADAYTWSEASPAAAAQHPQVLAAHSDLPDPRKAYDLSPDVSQDRPATATPHPPPFKNSRPNSNNAPDPLAMRESREWWEVPLAIPRWEDMGPKSFEFDMPEHLPNSPMCPANKKHKSGGTGVCVYHGRRKRSDVALAQDDGLLVQGAGPGVQGQGYRKLEGLLGKVELRDWESMEGNL